MNSLKDSGEEDGGIFGSGPHCRDVSRYVVQLRKDGAYAATVTGFDSVLNRWSFRRTLLEERFQQHQTELECIVDVG